MRSCGHVAFIPGQFHRKCLTHWCRVTICVVELAIIGSDNGLSPGRRQAIIWTNAGILLIGPLGTNFSEILIKILLFSFKKMRLKVSSAKWRPFCLGLNQGVQPWALTKFPDFSLIFPWPFCGFPWPWDILSAFHYCLNTNFANNLTNHSPKVAIRK